jgi:hypothetical protein
MRKRTRLILASGAAAILVASTVYAVPQQPHSADRTEQVSRNQGQIEAPPRPPQVKPSERTVAAR